MSSVIKVYNERQQTISVKNDTPPPTLQETVIESNGVFMPEDGYVGFGEVTVNVPPYGEGEVELTSNGTHNVSGKAVANVNVPSADSLIDKSITEIESNVTTIGEYAFCYSKLENGYFPNATMIKSNAFTGCSNLVDISIPQATRLSDMCFQSCTSLQQCYFPKVDFLGTQVFYSCSSLKKITLPLGNNSASSPSGVFYNCTKLETAYLPKWGAVGTQTFQNCRSLTKLIIATQRTNVINLSSTNAFQNCHHILGTVNSTYNPNGLKDGFIYVNASLVAQYRTATNWTTYASQIMPWVATIDELASIDGTLYDHACVGETEYVYNGVGWVEFIRGEV